MTKKKIKKIMPQRAKSRHVSYFIMYDLAHDKIEFAQKRKEKSIYNQICINTKMNTQTGTFLFNIINCKMIKK